MSNLSFKYTTIDPLDNHIVPGQVILFADEDRNNKLGKIYYDIDDKNRYCISGLAD
jgi:hypothetical protein